ncbi:MAG: hypothetical protein PVJ41_04625 [Desulfobacterales bacterium]|jgi:hypothetical protein
MVEIHIYGKLRQYLKEPETTQSGILKLSVEPEETVVALLARIGIPLDAIYTIFLNSKLLASRSLMAYRMGYQQVRENPLDWELDIVVKAGDRIGLFGRDMSALVV